MYARVLAGITLIVALGVTSGADADDPLTDTGNQLIKSCNQKNYEATNLLWAWCVGYVAGVDKGFGIGARTAMAEAFPKFTRDQVKKLGDSVLDYCAPANSTREQLALVVSKYLQDHPESLNQDNASLVIDAVRAAWPCPTENQPSP